MSIAHHLDYCDRLPFRLPNFRRVAWVSETAREVWSPRLSRIADAWMEVEWQSVIHGVRRAALFILPESSVLTRAPKWLEHDLDVVPIQALDNGMVRLAIGGNSYVARLQHAWSKGDHDSVGAILGYPPCCRSFFQNVWGSLKCTDTTWAMAVNSPGQRSGSSIELACPHTANILWRWLGVRLVPHLPCSFACTETAANADSMLSVGEKCGHAQEFAWIQEILSWPVEWSALHGIAEIRTPLLKLSTQTDATASKYVVRYPGREYPREGGQGLHFPWQSPSLRPSVERASFRRGIANPIPALAAHPNWYHRDNGFNTLHAMDRMHAPIVASAREMSNVGPGNVIDLGCGNGALLSKICHGKKDLVPFGVERNPEAIEHARVLHSAFSKNFVQADFLHDSDWTMRRYMLAIVMVGRLLEVSTEERSRVIERMRSCCDQILLYVYPAYSNENIDTLARRAGFGRDGRVTGAAGVQIVCIKSDL